MASKIKFIIQFLLIISLISSVFAFELKFEEGNEIIIYEQTNPIILHLTIDNTDAADYVSESSELSYLELKVIGKDENFVRLVNERDFKTTGFFIDKDVKEKLEVELRLPTTEKWNSEYIVMVAGVSPDDRQREAKITVKPSGEKVKTTIDKIPKNLLIIGLIGLILIILMIIGWDKFHKGGKRY